VEQMSDSGPEVSFQRVGDVFQLALSLPADDVESALLPSKHTQLSEDRRRLAAAMRWVEKLMPQNPKETGHREVIRALAVAAHSNGQAIDYLACRGFFREALAVSRSLFEAVVTARLLYHEPELHHKIREHESKTKQNILDSWTLADPPKKGAGHWFTGGFAALFNKLADYEPQISTQKSLTYQIGCSYTHSDLLSLRTMDRWQMARVACGFGANFLFILADLLDVVWHAGQNSDDINDAIVESFRMSSGTT